MSSVDKGGDIELRDFAREDVVRLFVVPQHQVGLGAPPQPEDKKLVELRRLNPVFRAAEAAVRASRADLTGRQAELRRKLEQQRVHG